MGIGGGFFSRFFLNGSSEDIFFYAISHCIGWLCGYNHIVYRFTVYSLTVCSLQILSDVVIC